MAAFGWVKRNIAAFGGDPDRITVFGQSAGALSIEALLTAPDAKGLFDQAILQSVGAMRSPATLAQAEAFGLSLGADIAELRQLPAADLIGKVAPVEGTFRDVTSPRAVGPVVDGVILPVSDREAFATGRVLTLPMIVGSIENEGGAFTRDAPIHTPADFAAYLGRNFPGHEADAARTYPASTGDAVKHELDRLFSDTQYNYGTRELLRAVSRRQPRTWRYLFTQRRNGGPVAPVHGDELQYVFGTFSGVHKGRTRPFDAADVRLSHEMTDAWVRFAATGDPNGGDLPNWRTYDAAADGYLELGTMARMGNTGTAARLDFLDAYFGAQTPVR